MPPANPFTFVMWCLAWATLVAAVIFVALGLVASELEYVRSGRRARYRAETAAMRRRIQECRKVTHDPHPRRRPPAAPGAHRVGPGAGSPVSPRPRALGALPVLASPFPASRSHDDAP